MKEIQIISNARICEVSVASPGSAASYVGTVRGVRTPDTNDAHTLLLDVPRLGGCRLQLKLLSLSDKSCWRLRRLAFLTEVPVPGVHPGVAHSGEQVGIASIS